ncbi:hypothetical protein [Streptomyces gossypiisoli]|uniref:hypothetical protein n=1 Tax=Streptomyces gossypiisoli TaxID=2748864 RepID=UPI0015DB374A|nr:hypothetical protein [Streptomyces gossypiisoli]
MSNRLTFTLAGRDELSRVMNGTADSADRLRLRLAGITADADGRLRDLNGRFLTVDEAMRRLAGQADNTRGSVRSLSEETGRLGEAINANLISLLPAAIPAVAGLASSAAAVATQLGAVALAAGAYALALGPQMGAISEATELQDKYEDALRTSGAGSEEASAALDAYQRRLAQLPPATREAAVAVGLLKDNYQEWSDSLSDDVMAPFIKGVAVTNALLPKTSGFVKDASGQFDRLITLVGGAISTPGFDALTGRVEAFTERTMREAVDSLTVFLAKLESGQYDDSGITRFFDYAQQAGPVVMDTLENVADALFHVLEAGSGVGMGMLDVINVLSGIVSAVPPDAIAVFLQLAIAIKAVKLAAAGSAAAGAAIAALGTQIAAARAAAAAAPGALAATGAAIGALSRTAKIAMAGTGIGLLLIALDQLGDKGRASAPDVDKLTLSLRNLADSGRFSGELAKTFGDMDGLIDKVRQLQTETEKANNTAFGFRIPGLDDAADWISGKINDISKGEESLASLRSEFDALDQGMAALVSNGYTTAAADNFQAISDAMRDAGYSTETINGLFVEYREAVAGHALENRLAAESMGLFGQQALEVQADLDAQKASADGLRQSIQALNDVNRAGLSGMIGFEAAIDAASKAAEENAGVLDMHRGQLVLNTEKQRAAATALNDLAAKTDEATSSARESGESWEVVNGIYERGRQQLIKNAMQMGLNRNEAKALADQILKTPDKTAKLRGNMEDLQRKLDEAKAKLKRVPDSRKAKVRAEISQLEAAIREARLRLTSIDGTTAHTYIYTHHIVSAATGEARKRKPGKAGHYAQGGLIEGYATGGPIPGYPDGGLLNGPGTPTSDSILLWGSTGEYMMRAAAVDHYGQEFFDALNAKEIPIGRAAPKPGLPAGGSTSQTDKGGDTYNTNYNITARKSVIDVDELRLLQRQEEARQRVGRPR